MVVKSKHEYNSGKQSVLGQLRNALNFCLPFKKDSEMEAYQLKTYLSNPKKAKLIFISGVAIYLYSEYRKFRSVQIVVFDLFMEKSQT